MNRILSLFLICGLIYCDKVCAQIGSAKIPVSGYRFKPFDLFVSAGASWQYPMGSLITNTKNAAASTPALLGSDYRGKASANSYLTFVVAAGIQQPITDQVSVLAGLQFTKLGYGIDQEVDYADPDYRRDDQIRVEQLTRVALVEVPLVAAYNFSPQDRMEAGIHLGFPIKSTAKTTATLRYDVFLNGERDDELSRPEIKQTTDERTNISGFVPGFSLAYRRYLLSNISVGATAQYVGSYYKSTEGNVGCLSLLATIRYHFKL